MLEEASSQVTQQAEALEKLGADAEERAAELATAQAQLSTAIASLDSTNANLADQTELISTLKVENTGEGLADTTVHGKPAQHAQDTDKWPYSGVVLAQTRLCRRTQYY